jgi:3-hydroxyacyl-CoA dehydrogenase
MKQEIDVTLRVVKSSFVGRVAVLGAGTMGSRIAAHFANAGIPSDLLDVSTDAATKGIQTAIKQKPGAFFLDSSAALITPGNFDEHLDRVSKADWIIEAVTEKLDIKRSLWKRVEPLRRADAIVSTNTSGIPLRQISEGFSAEFRRHFLGTHFFNPPRYLHLLELIPGADTDPEILAFVASFAERRLGKGIVPCKDTPNFIANRIGCFFCGTAFEIAMQGGYTVEEVDALTGPLIGLPNSATFRLLDIIGLDVMSFVGTNLYDAVPEDPWRERFLPPPFLKQMMERGWLGEKSGQGFYKRVGKDREIWALDLKTLEYHPAGKAKFPAVEAARNMEALGERLRALVKASDRAGDFLWTLFRDLILYSAERVPEISDRIVEVDRAMRWGYAHKLGPFELWDALGFEHVCDRIEKSGRPLPAHIVELRRAGVKSLYRDSEYVDLTTRTYRTLERTGLLLADCTKIQSNPGASLKDLGDGVLCVEFHSKMNALGEDHLRMLRAGLEETEKNFDAMLIANQGESFSAGANLTLILLAAQEGEWDELSLMIQRFQQLNLALKYARKPVVAAPFSRALGGGCEIGIHAHRIQASAETYMGLVEVGVGVVPAGGGTLEMLRRLGDARKALELIGEAKVSTSAAEARELGFLRETDRISMNPDLLIDDAKCFARSLIADYAPPVPAPIRVGGESALAMLKLGIWSYRQGNYISDYDVVVLDKLAHILSGGRLTGEQTVSEQYILDLEREAFLSLCGNPKTQERMAHTLKTGRPLRN